MTAADLARLIPDARETKPGRWSGPCPACGGEQRSGRFTFRDADDRVLVHCFACGDSRAILETLGLRFRDLSHNATARHDPQALRRRRAQAIVRSWRSSELTSLCERLRHFDLLEDQASRRLKADSADEIAWQLLGLVYAQRPTLERAFERLTMNSDAKTMEVFREHKEGENAA